LRDEGTVVKQPRERQVDRDQCEWKVFGRFLQCMLGPVSLGKQLKECHNERIQLSEDEVEKLSGVIGVTNRIMIKPRIEGRDVKRKSKDALRRHAAFIDAAQSPKDNVMADCLPSSRCSPRTTMVFPYERVYKIIDGTEFPQGHGPMPAWG
jgi:hypothetical protein